MELLIVGTWFGGLAGGTVIVIGAFQAVSGRSIFPFAWRGPGPSRRQITSLGVGWVVVGIALAVWTLASGLMLAGHRMPPLWIGSAASLVFVLGIGANFVVAALLAEKGQAK